jgi:hypothetical protein
VDVITLDPMSFASATAPSMTFDVSYAQYSSENDKLEVQVSTNCGSTWTTKYSKSGSTLATHVPVGTAEYAPSSAADWRHETVNLSTYAGQSNVLVRFKGTSAYGNDVFVDNVNFTPAAGVEENNLVNGVSVYPNPMSDNANIDFNLVSENNVTITMVNPVGQVIAKEEMGSLSAGVHNYKINAASFSNGLYFVNITVGNSTVTKKVVINK